MSVPLNKITCPSDIKKASIEPVVNGLIERICLIGPCSGGSRDLSDEIIG